MQFMVCLLVFSLASSHAEILVNPGFEEPLGDDNWECGGGCTSSLVSDSYSGSTSMKSANRQYTWQGPWQDLPLSGPNAMTVGEMYVMSGYVKLLPASSNSMENFVVTLNYGLADNTNQYQGFAFLNNVHSNDGWVKIEGEFEMADPNKPIAYFGLYVEGPGLGREFLVDSFSLNLKSATTTTPTTTTTTTTTAAPPTQGGEILRNGGFEEPLGEDNWVCIAGCSASLVSDSYSGITSLKSANRVHGTWQGPQQALPVTGGNAVVKGAEYMVEGYVKLLPGGSNSVETFVVTLRYSFTDDSVEYQGIANTADVDANDGWEELEGTFTTYDSSKTLQAIYLYIEGPAVGREFLIDAFSLRSTSAPEPTTTPMASTTTTASMPSSSEILKNGNLEHALGGDNWSCSAGCTGTLVNDAAEGSTAMKVSNRLYGSWQGPLQDLPIMGSSAMVPGAAYYIKGYVKLLPGSPNNNENIKVTLRHQMADGSDNYQGVAYAFSLHADDGWTYIDGDFILADYNQNLQSLTIFIEGPPIGREFLIDGFSLTQIYLDASWRNAANTRIESIRKSNLVIDLTAAGGSAAVTVQVRQLRHEFGFGSAVASYAFQNNQKYRQWYLDNFDWGVLENAFKWTQTEWTEGVFTWHNADEAVRILRENNKKIRGHTVFWAETSRNPNWVLAITNPTQLRNTCIKRANDLIGRYRGKCEHWDVNNEMMSNSFYKDIHGSDQIRYDMFSWVQQADPDAKLFLNDYQVVAGGTRTSAYVAQINEFLSNNVPVDGVGVQGHFTELPNGPIILNRLDRVAAPGLPIWVTELDYANTNAQTRADGLEDALRAFFSHPSVKGVLFWGFWEDRHWRGADASLVNGADMTPNDAGLMWQRLFHSEWRTTEDFVVTALSAGENHAHTLRVFHGDYNIQVIRGGVVFRNETITVSSENPTTHYVNF